MYPITTATKKDLTELMELYRSLFDTPGCTWSDDYPTEDIIAADLLAEHLFCMNSLVPAGWRGLPSLLLC